MDPISRMIKKKLGIASSAESNSRYEFFLLDKLEDLEEVKLEEEPEKLRVQLEATGKATMEMEMAMRELNAILPPKLVDSSEDELSVRFCDFMKAGGCKESFKALLDCAEDTDSYTKCKQHFPLLKKCMDAHFGYYQPILAIAKTAVDKMLQDSHALAVKEQQEELAARNLADEG